MLDLGRRSLEGLNVVVQAYRAGRRTRIGAERGEEEVNAHRSERGVEADPYGEPKDDGLTDVVHELFGDRGTAVGQNVDVTPIVRDLFGDTEKHQRREIARLEREKRAAQEQSKKTWTIVGVVGAALVAIFIIFAARKR